MNATCDVVIPARGGSKGIPGKNLRPVGGVPLVVRSVLAARAARLVRDVYVSTDDGAIAEAAKAAGARIIERPAEIAGDTASSESALLHALEAIERQGPAPDLLCFVQCTSPLTAAEDLDGGIAQLTEAKADSLFSALRVHQFLWRQSTEAGASGINHDASRRPRRQERAPEFLENGAFYVLKVAGFRQARHRFFGRVALFEMPRQRCLEIDEPADLLVAEAMLAAAPAGSGGLPERIGALVCDFDGVFTDNRVYVDQQGVESVACDRSDGLGLERLKRSGLPLLILSKERNPVVGARGGKLGIEVLQGIDEKLGALTAWAGARGIPLAEIVYIGNDDNDVACLQAVGCGVAVADAYPRARAAARLQLKAAGGRGALRELAELILARRGGG